MKLITAPRAVCGPVLAQEDANAMLHSLRASVQGFQDRYDSRVSNVENALETVMARSEAHALGIGMGLGGGAGADPEYSQAFASHVRSGDREEYLRTANASPERAAVHAAMTVGDNSTGGYLAPVEWDRQILQQQRATSAVRRIATVISTSVGAYTSLWSNDLWGSGWVGETAARPATTTPTLSAISFASGEIYANAGITQRLLDDAQVNVDRWLTERLGAEFNRQEEIAFISGNGVNKPAGLLTFAEGGSNAGSHPGGPVDVSESAITVDSLIDFTYGLGAPYRQNATWLMSSLTAATIAKMKDADGNLIWRESLIVGQPSTLLGRPVEIDEGMPPPTAGNLAIAFGDFKAGYVINDRLGTRILRDPYTNKPFVQFYCTKRVGGGLLDPNAIRVLKLPA